MKTDLVNFSQEYIESNYMEFNIPPKNNEVNKIEKKKKFDQFSFY